jgi:hypothetical protein
MIAEVQSDHAPSGTIIEGHAGLMPCRARSSPNAPTQYCVGRYCMWWRWSPTYAPKGTDWRTIHGYCEQENRR